MKKNRRFILLTLCALIQWTISFSQTDSLAARPDSLPQRHHVAIFAPLYLDSAFDAAGQYRYAKNFPKFINPGLEFWEGAQLAIDSMKKEGLQLEIHVYDTRSASRPLMSLLRSEEIKQMDLLIGHVVNANEANLLVQMAASLTIPFINVNLPIEAGARNNPYYVILNSTLPTQCAGIYKFLQKNYSVSTIVVFRKKGATEDLLRNYFTEAEKSTLGVPLKMKYVTLENNFTQDDITDYLDSNKTNVCLVASLDAFFGQQVCQQLAAVSSSYTTTVMGMPTWWQFDFEKPIFKGIEIYYSTPFYINPADSLALGVQEHFRTNFYSRPSDMVYRGYETIYHFGHLLASNGKNISSSLGDKKFKLFTQFDIQPVIDKQTMTLDYFENKKLYFVKKVDGIVKAVY
ncbi:amino acid ABC transporter substrate-binding protein [Pseudoflavitalea sp. X16]|uniref:amino acid ABC transporter substrate-binding protein n=1 Tax=Paraflavitalea devenefica TaxID=2716334 RepID=UPI0014208624|nr:amino acid ABC transporter substrate-binding protein [Paraflavitalea devenefica]NII27162.1 amino acid ABC transporter substrate-binding protein [Paraflavitalea devenefica]